MAKKIPVFILMLFLAAGCTRQTGTDEVSSQSPGEFEIILPTEEAGPPTVPSRSETIAQFPETEETGPTEPTEPAHDWEKTAIVATDIHYLARSLTDGGSGFQYMVEHGDGKVVTYVEPIVDAFVEEVIQKKPDVLILSGDLTLDGERKSHVELAEKLRTVTAAGIPVLVIPGNHDINNRHAAAFQGEERLPAEYTTPEEFREIYREFGYADGLSYDAATLSYVYEIDDYNRLLMLDTCQYKPRARVGGVILSDTYDWIEEQLENAWEDGRNVIPVGHHNLLDQSEIYVDDCTIEHGEQLADMLDGWDVPLFLSGHLHVQHTKRSEDDRGVWEMVTSSLTTPACQYGVLTFRDDGSFQYQTQAIDMESWARRHHRTESDLLNFDTFKEPFLRRVFYNQSADSLEDVSVLTAAQKKQMSQFYSDLNYHYYQGTAYQIKEKVLKDPAYRLWQNEGFLTERGDYVQYILEDAKEDYNYVEKD